IEAFVAILEPELLADPFCRFGFDLHEADLARRTHGSRVEAAFVSNQSHQEYRVKSVAFGLFENRGRDRIRGARPASSLKRFARPMKDPSPEISVFLGSCNRAPKM